MFEIINSRVSYVWLFLAALTGATWLLGDGYNPERLDLFKVVTICLLILAFFKIRLVIIHFMEIGSAPMPLRLIFDAWVILVCVLLILMYLFGMSLSF